MAISLSTGLLISGTDAVDTRLVMTKAEMVTAKGSKMPDNYICICKDDGKLYMWDKSFTPDPTYGRFKPYEEVMDLTDALNSALEDPTTKVAFEATLSDAIPGSLKVALSTQELPSGLDVDTDGNILVNTLTNEDIHDVVG